MAFRDEFLSGYSLGPRRRTFAQWSLERTVDSGLRANQRQMQELGSAVRSTFEQGIDRLAESHMKSASLLKAELQFQADNIIDAITRSSTDVVSAIQNTCDYLGGELREVRWALERQTTVSQHILEVLRNSLDNTSRQYYDQGVKCYETAEYDMARERFNRAIEANRTNYFAYQYLGFIAALNDDSADALKNFQLARKFADTDYHRALALSHSALALQGTGDLNSAEESAALAATLAPDRGVFWYDLGFYRVRLNVAPRAMQAFRSAILADWNYWSVLVSDERLDNVRSQIVDLLDTMRSEQQKSARAGLESVDAAIAATKKMGVTEELSAEVNRRRAMEKEFAVGTVFAFRDLANEAPTRRRAIFQIALDTLNARIERNRREVVQAKTDTTLEIAQAKQRVQQLEQRRASIARGVGAGVLLTAAGFGSARPCNAQQSPAGPFQTLLPPALLLLICLAVLFYRPIRRYLALSELASEIDAERKRCESFTRDAEARLEARLSGLDSEHARLIKDRDRCAREVQSSSLSDDLSDRSTAAARGRASGR